MNYYIFYKVVAPKADKRIDISKLPKPDGDYMREFERILQEQFGIKITNLSGHRIGCSKALPGPWLPKTEFRETLRGRLTKYEVKTVHAEELYKGSNGIWYMQEEYDWNLHIEPAESHREKFPVDKIVGEVTPGENFHDTWWFPLKGTGRPSRLLDYDICIYGPYVIDEGDDDNLEIHPIDAIWWRRRGEDNNQVRVILLQDAAKGRFREEGMFRKRPCDDDFPGWKPWIEYPQLEEIRIPFTYDPEDKKYWHIAVEVNTAMDITTHLQTDWRDSDDGAQHQLLQAGSANADVLGQLPILVRVTEESGFDNQHIAVQFTDLTRDAQGIIRGYVQLVAALGDKLNKHEGVMVLTLTFNQEVNEPPVLTK
jgi:hypothetical protein